MTGKFRMAAVAAIFAAAIPMPASAQITNWEECVLQCLNDYGPSGPMYRACRDECTRVWGPPPVISEPPVGKLD